MLADAFEVVLDPDAEYLVREAPGPTVQATSFAGWVPFAGAIGDGRPRLRHCSYRDSHDQELRRARTFGVHSPPIATEISRRGGAVSADVGTEGRPIRVHDLRATFVTVSLATGRTETWVADRTGHTSSVMINRYRRAARSLAEMGIGTLRPMHTAIPELSVIAREGQSGGANGKGNEKATPALDGLGDGNETRRDPVESRRVAEERTRTSTPLRALEPESSASASSATSAWGPGVYAASGGVSRTRAAPGRSEMFSHSPHRVRRIPLPIRSSKR